MKLFELIPDKFFNVLTSKHKNLYVEALFVLRSAFKLDVPVIRRTDLVDRFADKLETLISDTDFEDEMTESDIEDNASILGKAKFIVRQLLAYGWIEIEYEKNSFVENITIPDYSILIINLLYDITHEKTKEYNSYVYATYLALKNADEAINDENERDKARFIFEALKIAYENTEKLEDELKMLYQNIRRYAKRAMKTASFNNLLSDYFDNYMKKVVEAVYFPLKTTDSIPLFKNYIISTMGRWCQDDILELIVEKSKGKNADSRNDDSASEVMRKILFIADTYESIESLMDVIDKKHEDYTTAAIDRLRYILHADTSAQSRIAVILNHIEDKNVRTAMSRAIEVHSYGYIEREKSLYKEKKKRVHEPANVLSIEKKAHRQSDMDEFLAEARSRIGNEKIDSFVMDCFGDKTQFHTEDVRISSADDFVLFILATLRGKEIGAPYIVRFQPGDSCNDGTTLPRATFTKKGERKNV